MVWLASRRATLIGALSSLSLCAHGQCLNSNSLPLAMRFRRGVAVHGAFNWPSMNGGDYASDPFPSAQTLLAPKRLAALRAAGFDFIRLSVNPRIFIALARTPRYAELQAALQAGFSRILHAGMNVIVDLHSIGRDPENKRDVLIDDVETANRVGTLIEQFAGWLGRGPQGRLALEFWNEPDVSNGKAAKWDELQSGWHVRARRTAPKLTLVVAGLHTGDVGLEQLDACRYNDGNTIFDFHFYDPTPFTLQGETAAKGSTDPMRFFAHVPYPITPDETAAAVASARQRLNAATELTADQHDSVSNILQGRVAYLNQRDNPAWITARFDKVADWAASNNVSGNRIMLGEFGVMRPGVDPMSRQRWLFDVRRAAEQRGFAWSLWAYDRAATMGLITDDTTGALDQRMLTALGLRHVDAGTDAP